MTNPLTPWPEAKTESVYEQLGRDFSMTGETALLIWGELKVHALILLIILPGTKVTKLKDDTGNFSKLVLDLTAKKKM